MATALADEIAKRLRLVDAQAAAGLDRTQLLQQQCNAILAKIARSPMTMEDATSLSQTLVAFVLDRVRALRHQAKQKQ